MIDLNNVDETQLWLILFGGGVGAVILIELVRRFIRARPCWFFNHRMRHLSIEKRVWPPIGACPRCDDSLISSYKHERHFRDGRPIPCYVTKWICAKEGCEVMGTFCVGGEDEGAWTIRHGEVVPDEKEWSKW
jgi:hypothetical protein